MAGFFVKACIFGMMKISVNQIKHIQSLRQKKYRDRHRVFVAEGDKIVQELLHAGAGIDMLCALAPWMEKMGPKINSSVQSITVSPKELERISSLKTPNQVLAVVRQSEHEIPGQFLPDELILILENIQDPGNLGTMIRTADWFGVRHIICSPDTADIYNPKVIQASMGSFMRVKLFYSPLEPLIEKIRKQLQVYGAFMEGEDPFAARISLPAALLIGNESGGISKTVGSLADHKLCIPRFNTNRASQQPESLNAAMAAGIIMAWIRQTGQPA